MPIAEAKQLSSHSLTHKAVMLGGTVDDRVQHSPYKLHFLALGSPSRAVLVLNLRSYFWIVFLMAAATGRVVSTAVGTQCSS